eukprot:gnl/Dysnectes_brevis/1453_a1644_3043.p1 GENE.gnl/Dysnectes_brevis/1453_a1644_3043~~gnl/Dysnectes_brevis/1453_a1644_3043.p1  ORF type:complete len:202 (-),score=36.12 gnl/Dysnectes_brevis/1453_a1644_3043:133-738(-)
MSHVTLREPVASMYRLPSRISSPTSIDHIPTPILSVSNPPRPSSASLSLKKSFSSGSRSEGNIKKTELCTSWLESGTCQYQKKCTFAHGLHELRTRRQSLRTKQDVICRSFHQTGICGYGRRCRFTHEMPYTQLSLDSCVHVTIVQQDAERDSESEESIFCPTMFHSYAPAPSPALVSHYARSPLHDLLHGPIADETSDLS